MKITLYNFKGGVGKTSLSLALAKEFNFGYISNDGIVHQKEEEKKSLFGHIFKKNKLLELSSFDEIPNLPEDYNVVFDLGGFISDKVIPALTQSDIVIIPTDGEPLSIEKTINTIEAVSPYNGNILVVATKVRSDAEYRTIKERMLEVGYKIPIPLLRNSTAFSHVYKKGKSLSEIMKEDPLLNNSFSGVRDDFSLLIKMIEKLTDRTNLRKVA